jgi:Uncharacterized Fe-S center protein
MKSVNSKRRDMIKYLLGGAIVGHIPALTFGQEVRAEEKTPVYFTRDLSSKGVNRVFDRVKDNVRGKTTIKLHVGDPGNKNFLSPDLVKDLCLRTKATLCDSNVLYGGRRGSTDSHKEVAKEHGFSFAEFDVLDADGDVALPVKNGKHLKEAYLGKNILNYDSIIVLTHFKGHAMAGFGGAMKNIGVGIASKRGKGIVHGNWQLHGKEFLEHVIEYASALTEARKNRIVYISVLNNLSVRCDCDSSAPPPVMPDIGILASTDIVAIEKASLDLLYKAAGEKGNALTHHIEEKTGAYQIQYAQKLGMGNASYRLIEETVS